MYTCNRYTGSVAYAFGYTFHCFLTFVCAKMLSQPAEPEARCSVRKTDFLECLVKEDLKSVQMGTMKPH